jgi:hypothetical protein
MNLDSVHFWTETLCAICPTSVLPEAQHLDRLSVGNRISFSRWKERIFRHTARASHVHQIDPLLDEFVP